MYLFDYKRRQESCDTCISSLYSKTLNENDMNILTNQIREGRLDQ